MYPLHTFPGSYNGSTGAFGALCRGSNPCPGTLTMLTKHAINKD